MVLDSVVLYNFIPVSFCPTCFKHVLDLQFNPPYLTPIATPYLTLRCRFDLYFHPLLPQLSQARSDHPPGQGPHPPASTARLRFPPFLEGYNEVLNRSCVLFPLFGCPPFANSRPVPRSLSSPWFLLPEVPFLPLPASVTCIDPNIIQGYYQ